MSVSQLGILLMLPSGTPEGELPALAKELCQLITAEGAPHIAAQLDKFDYIETMDASVEVLTRLSKEGTAFDEDTMEAYQAFLPETYPEDAGLEDAVRRHEVDLLREFLTAAVLGLQGVLHAEVRGRTAYWRSEDSYGDCTDKLTSMLNLTVSRVLALHFAVHEHMPDCDGFCDHVEHWGIGVNSCGLTKDGALGDGYYA
jgi:hypothetical protein